jgi:hypothetical protein
MHASSLTLHIKLNWIIALKVSKQHYRPCQVVDCELACVRSTSSLDGVSQDVKPNRLRRCVHIEYLCQG